MTKKLSRRSLLKMAAALAASGVVGWKSDEIEAKADITPVIGVDPAVTGGDETVIVELEQPFAPYSIDPAGLRHLWETLRKAETDD